MYAFSVSSKDLKAYRYLNFKTSDDCLKYLSELKWKEGFICWKCGYTNSCAGSTAYSKQCTSCRYVESPVAQTLFHQVKFDLLNPIYKLRGEE